MKTKTIKSDPDKLTEKHHNLTHSDNQKVISHVMRDKDEWVLHTIMIKDCNTPFKFRRKDKYLSLKGARVNITYYPTTESVSGIEFEIMSVVRIKRA